MYLGRQVFPHGDQELKSGVKLDPENVNLPHPLTDRVTVRGAHQVHQPALAGDLCTYPPKQSSSGRVRESRDAC